MCLALLLLPPAAQSRDLGQWESESPALRAWYQSLMQPDQPTVSCCGEADAYWCDGYSSELRDGEPHAYCTIDDDREDAPRGRPHVTSGTKIEIPQGKLQFTRGNPDGHGVIFLAGGNHAAGGEYYVFCYVQPGGV